jgi:hypothetical protein
MLTYRVRGVDDGPAYELKLVGKFLEAHKLRWVGKPVEQYVADGMLAYAQWDFAHHEVLVSHEAMPQALVDVANRVFGAQLKELDATRQEGLFPNACSVCGDDKNRFPETAVRDGYGNIMETRGKPWMAPNEPIEWRCRVCERLVCRNCTLTRPDSRMSDYPFGWAEYYATTYCSEACRAAAPADMHHDDEVMR